MFLADALELRSREVVAFVGAGGKTTAMFRLARELRDRGKRVVVTTTTKIFRPEVEEGVALVIAPAEKLVEAVQEAIRDAPIVVAGTGEIPFDPLPKLDSVPVPVVEALRDLPEVDHVLVEADGSRRLPLTAPIRDEPVIPPCAGLLVPVCGIDAIGLPLEEGYVRNATVIQELTGQPASALITEAVVATVLLHPQGNVRGAPPGVRIVPLINKVAGPVRVERAREVARLLLGQQDGRVRRVLLTGLLDEPPEIEVVDRA